MIGVIHQKEDALSVPDITSSDNQDFFEYWCGLRKNTLIPEKTDFLPEEIPKTLPTMVVYEMISKKEICFYLVGSLVEARNGAIRVGENYLNYVAEDRQEKASEALWVNQIHPSAMCVIVDLKSKNGLVKRVESLGVPIICTKTNRKFIYFSSFEIKPDIREFRDPNDQVEMISVVKRTFLDIGAGIPNFKD